MVSAELLDGFNDLFRGMLQRESSNTAAANALCGVKRGSALRTIQCHMGNEPRMLFKQSADTTLKRCTHAKPLLDFNA